MFRTIRRTELLKMYIIVVFITLTTNMIGSIQVPYIVELGGGIFEVNLIITISSTIGILFLFPFGILSDRFGRRSMLILPMLFQFIGYVIFSLATNPSSLIIASVFNGFVGMEFLPVLQAMVSDLTEPRERMEVFSLFFFFASLGLVLGPTITTILLGMLGLTLRNIYQIVAIGILAFIVFLVIEVKETYVKTKDEEVEYRYAVTSLLRQKDFQAIIMVSLPYFFGNSIMQTYVPMLGLNYLKLSNAEVASISIYRNLATMIIRILTPIILTKISPKRFLISALALEGVTGFASVFANNYLSISILFFSSGLVQGIVQNMLTVLVANNSTKENRGTANSIFMGVMGIGNSSQIFTTPIATAYGLIPVLMIAGIIGGLASISFATRLPMRIPSVSKDSKI